MHYNLLVSAVSFIEPRERESLEEQCGLYDKQLFLMVLTVLVFNALLMHHSWHNAPPSAGCLQSRVCLCVETGRRLTLFCTVA